jgi:hypothetical protein
MKRTREDMPLDRDEKRPEARQWTMKAGSNWEGLDGFEAEEHPNTMHIDPALIPEGMDLQWVTDSVLGKPFPEHRAAFERRGWTPVHPEDFDGRFDGMFDVKGSQGEIQRGGQVLMARPMELSRKAKRRESAAASDQVMSKVEAIKNGDLAGVTLDSRHKSALLHNHVTRSVERIAIPD